MRLVLVKGSIWINADAIGALEEFERDDVLWSRITFTAGGTFEVPYSPVTLSIWLKE